MATGFVGLSQNGWPCYDDDHFRDHAVLTEVEGVKFWSANADVAVVMDDFTQQFHDQIEPIDLPVKEWPGYDDWSRALRPVRGQSKGYSNHGSCTARDLNSTRHPRGVHGTYTKAKRAALKELVDSYGGVLRHGEFYSSTIDGMHVEINAGPALVKREADRIRAKGKLIVDEKDEKKIRAIVAAEMDNAIARFMAKPSIPNLPTEPGQEQGGDWPPGRLFANMDAKLDKGLKSNSRQEVLLGQIAKAVVPTTPTDPPETNR